MDKGPDPLHLPVLLDEVLSFVPQKAKVLDLTLGRGGHSEAILNLNKDNLIIAWDRDQDAVEHCKTKFKSHQRIQIVHENFHELPHILETSENKGVAENSTLKNSPSYSKSFGKTLFNFDEANFVLIDLGVSSPQLDQELRGFSFYKDGPLDMRMDQRQNLTAQHIINSWSEIELVELFTNNAEISRCKKAVRFILEEREKSPITSTLKLAETIERALGWQTKGKHPATPYFLALRIEVNDELSPLKKTFNSIIKHLPEKARIAVITFHSTEDRVIKAIFKESKLGAPLFKKVIQPPDQEVEANPRSRSAKLRILKKTQISNSAKRTNTNI